MRIHERSKRALIRIFNRGSFVDTRLPVSNLTSKYDGFLYAPICKEPNGMQLSVLSALARINIDPWQEANRLATLPKVIAETTLASTLNLLPDRKWDASETQLIAARLVRLLPKVSKDEIVSLTEIATPGLQQTHFWWVWLGFALAISFLSPHHRASINNRSSTTSSTLAPSEDNRQSAPSRLPATDTTRKQ